MRHFLTLSAVVLAGVAQASPVAFSATGTFASAEGTLNPDLLSKSFRFDIAYDTSVAPAGSYTSGSAQVAFYPLTSFFATVDGKSYVMNTFSFLSVTADGAASSYGFGGFFYPDGSNEGQGFFLDFQPASSLSSPDVPLGVADLGTVTRAEFDEVFGIGEFGFNGRASASMASVQAVPEPASLAALGLGALGLVRRRRAQQGALP